ncbi:MAG TPA: hypothetical protein VFV38_20665 [Ktedonobacteraceae bacterium]|nr:hypothetical protein [Ktedonobacteraceae bacterium]
MPEGVIQPETNHEPEPPQDHSQPEQAIRPAAPVEKDQERAVGDATRNTRLEEKIIWTPAFILIFVLTLVLGLSAESLFTQGWYTQRFSGQWIILAHIILVACGWLSLGIVTRSRWKRTGCIFGGLAAAFMTLNIFINLQGTDPNAPLQSYSNVAACMAMLGAFIGLSIEDTSLSTWDSWLFRLFPFLAAAGTALTYFLTPQASILTTENALATAALIASCLIWWLRPSCWRRYPGPTFLFGLVPAILLAMAPINMSIHSFFLLQITAPHVSVYSNANNFFFAQATQLCLLLGCMRFIKSELVN